MSHQSKSDEPSGQSREVVKHRDNVLQRFPKYYVFVSRKEGPKAGPWHLVGSCMRKTWMDAVWKEMQAIPGLADELIAALGGDAFEAAYPRITQDVQALQGTHDAWWWLVDRSADASDPMEHSGLELMVPPGWDDIEVGHWYVVELSNVIDDPTAPERPYAEAPQCFHTVFVTGDPDAEQTVLRQALSYARVPDRAADEPTQAVLKALHFIHANPRGTPPPPRSGGGPGVKAGGPSSVTKSTEPSIVDPPQRPLIDDPPEPIGVHRSILGPALDTLVDVVRSGGERLRRLFEPVFPLGGLPGLVPAFAGAGGAGWLDPRASVVPDRRSRPPAVPSSSHYVGSPTPAGMQPQQANPLVAGPHQAFVAVLDVGQGNCNAIYDDNGHILAYYDMGHPWGHMASSRPGLRAPAGPYTPLTPCVCDRPLVILSHFDLDHFKMGLDQAITHNLTWLVPQQVYGPDGTRLVNAVRDAGGQIHVWAAAGGHMRFPWGFVERCTAPAANLNGSGLAAFVCMRDDPVVVRMQTTVGGIAALLPGPLANGVPADVEVYSRAVAASLAHGQALGPANMAAAAFRATVAARLGGAAATGGAVTAFVAGNGGGAAALAAVLHALNAGMLASLPAGVALGGGPAGNTAASAIAVVAAAAGIPAGNAARAAAAAGPFGAPAGTVEHVCHPVVAGAAGANVNITQSNDSQRARAAVAAVPAMVGALVGAPANTLAYSRTVAAAFAAAAISTGTTPNGAAAAAVRAVVALLVPGGRSDAEIGAFLDVPGGGPAAAVRAQLDAHNVGLRPSLPAMPAPHGVWPPNFVYLAAAARATVGVGVGNVAGQLAAFTGVAIFSNATASRAALDPQRVLGVTAGAAPFAPGERFVHLNADANFDFVPSLQLAEPPLVAAMTAMHHGAALEDGDFIASARIPWAPGSAASADPAVADAADNNCSAAHCIAETANQLQAGAGAGAGLIGQVAHAGAAAAAAVLAADARALPGGLTGPHWRAFAQATAAAVLSRLIAATEAAEVAMAATLAGNHRPGLTAVHDFADAARIARVRLRGGTAAAAIPPFVTAAHPNMQTANVSGMAAVVGAALGLTFANIQSRTVLTAQALGFSAHQRTLVAFLAGCAWVAANAGAGVGNEAAAIVASPAGVGAGTLAADVSAVMALELTDPHNNPVDAQEVARAAATYAMVAEAIRRTGVPATRLTTALDAIAEGTHQAAATANGVSAGHGPGPVAYSYGVRAGNLHCYPAPTLGGHGHPHPLAIADYEAHGWTVRRNAVANANHGAAQTDASPCGHVALAWDYANDRNLVHANGVGARVIADPAMVAPNANGLVDMPACAGCGQRIKLNL